MSILRSGIACSCGNLCLTYLRMDTQCFQGICNISRFYLEYAVSTFPSCSPAIGAFHAFDYNHPSFFPVHDLSFHSLKCILMYKSFKSWQSPIFLCFSFMGHAFGIKSSFWLTHNHHDCFIVMFALILDSFIESIPIFIYQWGLKL